MAMLAGTSTLVYRTILYRRLAYLMATLAATIAPTKAATKDIPLACIGVRSIQCHAITAANCFSATRSLLDGSSFSTHWEIDVSM